MRTPLVAGNWKLHLTLGEAAGLATSLKEGLAGLEGREVMVAPVFTALSSVAQALEGSSILLGAQNLFWEDSGAYTGEVSAPLLRDAGCSHVIIGHSERRQYFGETDESVNRRVRAALGSGMVPVVCIGESLEEREAGRAEEVVGEQLRGGLMGYSAAEASSMVVAYEPVWAIGTGKTATPGEADAMHGFIRSLLSGMFGDIVSDRLRILYGGSVKPENVDELMAQPHIDGALVGGASLKAESFVRIARFASA